MEEASLVGTLVGRSVPDGDPPRLLSDSLLLSALPPMFASGTTLSLASKRASQHKEPTMHASGLEEASLVGTLVGRSVPDGDPPRLLSDSLFLSAPPPMSAIDATLRFANARAF